MRGAWRAITWRLAGAALLLAIAAPAGAAPPTAGLDLSNLAAGLPPPADTGKPVIAPPLLAQPDPDGCLPLLPCGTRLRGAIRKDGAVELQVPALRW